jgi:hypothetical protein
VLFTIHPGPFLFGVSEFAPADPSKLPKALQRGSLMRHPLRLACRVDQHFRICVSRPDPVGTSINVND